MKAEAFGRRLRDILKDQDLTQSKVQKDTGLSQQAISGWCRGLHLPRGRRLQTLADYLQMEPRKLCPEAFDDRVAQHGGSAISFSPVDNQPGWYILSIGGMPVDEQMMRAVLKANQEFSVRKSQDGFEDVKL